MSSFCGNGSGMRVKWQGLIRFRISSEGELIGLAGALDIEYEGRRGIRDDFKVLCLSS